MEVVIFMKRIKIVILVFAVFMLTGCADTLKCEIDTSNYTSSVKVVFENNKPASYKYSDKMIFNDNLSTDSELYYHSQYSKYSYLVSEDFAKVTNFANKVSVDIEYNFNESNSQGEESLLVSRNDNMKSASKKIESLGYKCK